MKDERIQSTINRFAARGFNIWFWLLLVSICYRLLILKQHPRDYWDIFAILLIGTFYVSIANASKGILAVFTKRALLAFCIGLIIWIVMLNFIVGNIHSVGEAVESLIGSIVGMGLLIGMGYFLHRRWKRKAGIEDEE